ncbi:synaptonemal complex protein 1 isoform X1 [Syngnathus acus]|uniref:synaptonemal complex protein 1 isoform X1 n=2 Tax=Syngnathus acus TaxID=161584 RepID=UPI001885EDD9|nr:synaptonemal complex protein 1 isoform X1 [Syngnathus acus]
MEKDGRFNFRLLVPPRVSAVKPQEIVDNRAELGPSKYFVKDQNNKSAVAPSQPTTPDCSKMTVAPAEKEESNCSPGQLCSKMFDEVEKIKFWKVKVDSDAAQSGRKLQENKQTIETQRNAIQELQFQNESLSTKLEEQMSENEDWRNKHNATRDLCNLLKETLERSADKMQLFESEREETHHLLMKNSERVQKVIAAFELLRGQAEAEQEKMQSVTENLQKIEALKETYHQECTLKEKEVATLIAKLQDKESELEKVQHDLHDTQNQCRQLEEAKTQQCKDLRSSKMAQDSLLEKLNSAEQRYQESETSREVMGAVLRRSKEEHAQILQSKDLSLQEVHRVKNEQAEKLEQVQRTLVELQNSLAFEEQRSKDCEEKLMAKNKELERSNQALEEMVEQRARIDEQITVLQSELETNVNSLEIVKGKADVLEIRVNHLQAELSAKTIEVKLVMDEAETIRAENENLKKVCEKSEVFMEEHNLTERKVQELEEKFFNEVKKTETYSFEIVQLKKDLTEHQAKYEELLSDFNEVHLEKKAVEQKFESKSSNVKAIEADMKVSEKKAAKLSKEIQKLEEENQRLRVEICTIQSLHQRQCEEIETLQKKMEDSCEHLQKKVTQTERQLKAAEVKCSHLSKKIGSHLKAGEYQKEIKKLKSQITKELVKYSHLENKMSSLDEESRNQKRELEEKHQELLKELHDKSIIMQELQATAAEAIKSKEDAELKCQIKTADTVALMSKYERTVKEKDAELDEMKKRETMAVSFRLAAELDVTRLKTENSQLKKQLTTDKDNFQKKLSDQKKELSLLKSSQLSQDKNSTAKAFDTNEGESHVETPRSRSSKMNVFDFAEESGFGFMRMSGERTPKIKELRCKEIASPVKRTKRAGKEDKIKTYRIRTPPSATKPGVWGKGAIELQSDGSDPNNILTFKNVPATHFSVPVAKCNPFQKSPTTVKPPGASLKLAAVKRIRDAGWLAVNSSEKKKRSHANNFI